ncbi:MAG TPA: hypothetical protein VII98_09445, partial [Solirubrobacteraceae bacterium]
MAVRILAGERLHPIYDRQVQDLDFVLAKRHTRDVERLLAEAGYVPEEQFNALNGHRRLLFHDDQHGRQIDVFVDSFEMCHVLPLTDRLTQRPGTLPAAEVLMTKLQIVHLNSKDRGDLYALLHSHDVTSHDEEAVNVDRIAELTGSDWGLQRTFELNLGRLREGLPGQALSPDELHVLARRIDAVADAMEQAPKSRKWKLRARVGDRKRWYEEPEEVDREG